VRESRYLHGSRPEERARLGLLNDLLNAQELRELRLELGESVLDLGCGPAIFARAMAGEVGDEGRVVGIERDPDQIAEAARLARGDDVRVEIRRGDALAPPLADEEWGSFDLVHARFLLEHLVDPAACIRTALRAARPGGRVFLVDDDHDVLRLHPEPRGFVRLWEAYVEAFRRLGNDPFVGRRLAALLHETGAVSPRTGALFFGSCAGHPSFPGAVANLIGVVRGAEPAIVGEGILPAPEFAEASAALSAWGARTDAALWYVAHWAEGTRPG
jgi:SAM-dependent methyltransferase